MDAAALEVRDQALAELVELARRLCGTRVAFVVLDRGERSELLARSGLPEAAALDDQGPIDHLLEGHDLTELRDAEADRVLTGTDGVRVVLGARLPRIPGGERGALCVADARALAIGERQRECMRLLAQEAATSLAVPARLRRLMDVGLALEQPALDLLGEAERKVTEPAARWSPTALRILGLDLPPASPAAVLSNLPTDEQPRFAAWRDRLLAGESAASIRLRVPRGDGLTRQIEAHGRFRPGPADERAMVVVIADVTTRYLLGELAEELGGLRPADELVEATQQVALLGSWEHDERGSRSTAALRAILGLSDPLMPGQILELVHEEDRKAALEAVRAASANREAWAFRARMRRADDHREIVVESRGFAELDAEGNVTRSWGTLQDITALIRSEEAVHAAERRARDAESERRLQEQHLRELEASQQLLQAVIDGAPAMIYGKDRQARYLFVNQAVERRFGLPRSEIEGRDWREFTRGDGLELLDAQDRRVLDLGESAADEVEVDNPDGSTGTWIVQKFPLRTADGSIYGLCGIARDISDSKTIEAAGRLRGERQSLISALATHVAEGVAAGDLAAAAAAVARQGTGARTAVVLERRDETLELVAKTDELGPDDQPRLAAVASRAMAEGRLVIDGSAAAAPVPGFDNPVRAIALISDHGAEPGEKQVPWLGDDHAAFLGEIARLLAIAWSRDRARELERQLIRAQRLESVGKLAGGVAHDFNNLLAVIINYASFVADGLPEGDEDLRADIGEIIKAAERAADLTRRLLLFGRGERSSLGRCQPNDVIGELSEMLRRTLGSDVKIELSLSPDAPEAAIGADELEQAIAALAVNSREAMPNGGTLGIGTAGSAHGLRIAVTDDGEGMTEEILEHALEPFFSTKGPGEGTGLGLSTVHGIVSRSGGTMSVDSQPGRGTCVTIELPPATPSAPARTVPGAAETSPGTGTILLVEDQEAVRAVVRRILVSGGYAVIEADGPDQARAALEGGAGIDLLLTDVVMPGGSGPELAASLDGDHAVLFMSGYADAALVGHEVGAALPLIQKPFTRQELLERIAGALAARAREAS